ncbi:hypothetical protein DPMN_058057 [Dreissena polymorpha]|uniref:Uncharacterized protein n=1 Tax=Dreissena polymorpha TaxID=45954 RepID=A0A9D4C1A4_DREPO|nr:hypothetical protein DPMN_058057 [Dreissena polymorpha]
MESESKLVSFNLSYQSYRDIESERKLVSFNLGYQSYKDIESESKPVHFNLHYQSYRDNMSQSPSRFLSIWTINPIETIRVRVQAGLFQSGLSIL